MNPSSTASSGLGIWIDGLRACQAWSEGSDRSHGSQSSCNVVKFLTSGQQVYVKNGRGSLYVSSESQHTGFVGYKIN